MNKLIAATCLTVIGAIGVHYYQQYSANVLAAENAYRYGRRLECLRFLRGEIGPLPQDKLDQCAIYYVTYEEILYWKKKRGL